MAGFSKTAVAHPDQGSLQDYCSRLGIDFGSVVQNPDPAFQREAHDMMQALTGLAYAEPIVDKHWSERCTWHVVNDPKRNFHFWWKLENLKNTVFGPFWPVQFDAGDLISHPWSLSPDDFKKTYDALQEDQLPANLPAQRDSAKSTFQWLAGFLGAGAGVAATNPASALALPWIGAATAGAWGVSELAGFGEGLQLKQKMTALRASIPDLVQRYKVEATFRAKLSGGPAPMSTISNAQVRLGL